MCIDFWAFRFFLNVFKFLLPESGNLILFSKSIFVGNDRYIQMVNEWNNVIFQVRPNCPHLKCICLPYICENYEEGFQNCGEKWNSLILKIFFAHFKFYQHFQAASWWWALIWRESAIGYVFKINKNVKCSNGIFEWFWAV